MTAEAVFRLAGAVLLGALLASALKRERPEFALLLGMAVCLAGFAALLPLWEGIAGAAASFVAWSGLAGSVFGPLSKTLCIAVVSRISADLCRDAGQSAMASVVETGGVLGAAVVAMPLLEDVWELLVSLL